MRPRAPPSSPPAVSQCRWSLPSHYSVPGGRSLLCRTPSPGRNSRSHPHVTETPVGRESGILRSRDCRGRGPRSCILAPHAPPLPVRKNWYWRGCNAENGWRRRVPGRQRDAQGGGLCQVRQEAVGPTHAAPTLWGGFRATHAQALLLRGAAFSLAVLLSAVWLQRASLECPMQAPLSRSSIPVHVHVAEHSQQLAVGEVDGVPAGQGAPLGQHVLAALGPCEARKGVGVRSRDKVPARGGSGLPGGWVGKSGRPGQALWACGGWAGAGVIHLAGTARPTAPSPLGRRHGCLSLCPLPSTDACPLGHPQDLHPKSHPYPCTEWLPGPHQHRPPPAPACSRLPWGPLATLWLSVTLPRVRTRSRCWPPGLLR